MRVGRYISRKICVDVVWKGYILYTPTAWQWGTFYDFIHIKETSKRQELQKHENLILKTVVI